MTNPLYQRLGSGGVEHPSLSFIRCTSRDPSLHPATQDPCCEEGKGHTGKHRRRVVRGPVRKTAHVGVEFGWSEWSDP